MELIVWPHITWPSQQPCGKSKVGMSILSILLCRWGNQDSKGFTQCAQFPNIRVGVNYVLWSQAQFSFHSITAQNWWSPYCFLFLTHIQAPLIQSYLWTNNKIYCSDSLVYLLESDNNSFWYTYFVHYILLIKKRYCEKRRIIWGFTKSSDSFHISPNMYRFRIHALQYQGSQVNKIIFLFY